MLKILLFTAMAVGGTAGNAVAGGFLPGDINCLAQNIFYEARGEPEAGWRAVADVTLNRVADPRWPSTICGVVFQANQFSWTASGNIDEHLKPKYRELYQRIIARAKEYVNDSRKTSANHYARRGVMRGWMSKMTPRGVIGSHKFFQG